MHIYTRSSQIRDAARVNEIKELGAVENAAYQGHLPRVVGSSGLLRNILRYVRH